MDRARVWEDGENVMARVIQVIETVKKRGKGTREDVVRNVVQYWSLEGELLAENDPVLDGIDRTIDAKP